MNPLQQKEFELLREFIRVCEKLELRYYLVCGSALGAQKYGGFIPWDDDVDVALMREDYEIFLEQAQSLLPERIFLQNYRTDPEFPAIFSKLRDSGTTYIERSASRLRQHHGIYIDIFPLDGYPEARREQRKLELKKAVCRRLLSTAFRPNRRWKWLVIGPCRMLGLHRHTQAVCRYYENAVRAWSPRESERIANHGNWQKKLDYAPAWHYGAGSEGRFEGLTVRLPGDCNAYLRQKYGDYTIDPPKSKQIGHHTYAVCDCRRPYWHYTEERK